MLHSYYYVNGKRVSLDYYEATARHNAYMEEAVKKAVDYYEKHQFEWLDICTHTPENLLAQIMVMRYESTEDGRRFKKEWETRMQKQNKIAYIVVLLIIIAVFAIGIYAAFSK